MAEVMEFQYLIDIFDLESQDLDASLRRHPRLRPLLARSFTGVDLGDLRRAYLQLLKLSADYTQYTVPALRAAGEALRDGDAIDRRWSELFLSYAIDETDVELDYGHHAWAHDDMAALGAPAELLDAPPHPSAVAYGDYFVEDARHHPYAILGAKGVLEHTAIRTADDIARGVLDSGIPEAASATRFFHHHGLLDIDHVREGSRHLQGIEGAERCRQIVAGAYFTSGTYRALLHQMLA
jgi:hypothetical protein